MYTFNEDCFGDCYRFKYILSSLPTLGSVGWDLDWKVKYGYYNGGPSNGVHPKMIVL